MKFLVITTYMKKKVNRINKVIFEDMKVYGRMINKTGVELPLYLHQGATCMVFLESDGLFSCLSLETIFVQVTAVLLPNFVVLWSSYFCSLVFLSLYINSSQQ